MENDCPAHLSPNLHFNLQIKMPKRKLRSETGLLNTLQLDLRRHDEDRPDAARPRHLRHPPQRQHVPGTNCIKIGLPGKLILSKVY